MAAPIVDAPSASASPSALLSYREDHYGGVIVGDLAESSAEVFAARLAASIAVWRAKGKRGVWLRVPLAQSALIAPAVAQGFEFHHAKPGASGGATLTLWLASSPNTLPHYAFHNVGVGGFVYREDTQQVLVIQEKSGPVKKIWKLPGGSVDPAENLHAAVAREVLEETGIQATVVSLLGFRQTHSAPHGCSDLYFCYLLKADTTDIQAQETEIAAARWMSYDEFVALPYWRGLYGSMMRLGVAAVRDGYKGITMSELPIVFRNVNEFLYHACDPLPQAKLEEDSTFSWDQVVSKAPEELKTDSPLAADPTPAASEAPK